MILSELVKEQEKNKEGLLTMIGIALFFERSAKANGWEVRSLIEHARMRVSNREYEKAVRLLEEAQTISPQPNVDRYLKSIQNLLLSSRLKF